jgi:hypothetical protein
MAALEAASRPAVAYDGMTKHSVFVILCAAYTAAWLHSGQRLKRQRTRHAGRTRRPRRVSR